MAWKGFGTKLRLMCQGSDQFLYRCRLQACGLATAAELVVPAKPGAEKGEKKDEAAVAAMETAA